jgi:arogenate dehydrogenase (NADP+)
MKIWESYGCNLIEMSCEQHDEFTARSQFVTHFIARSLNDYVLDSTPIDTPSYRNLCDLSTGLCKDSMDLFQSLYRYNPFAETQMQKIKDSMSIIELQLRSADRTLAKL